MVQSGQHQCQWEKVEVGVFAGPEVSESGLVLALDAGNTKSYPGSGTTWTDLSGRGNNGTLTNGPTYSGANGGSIVFDGVDDYGSVSCSQFQSGNNPLSMEVWFKWSGNGANTNNVIFSYGLDGGSGIGCPLVAVSSSKFLFSFGSGQGDVLSNTTLQTNTWYHGIAVYDKSTTKVYLNGILENTTNYSTINIVLSGSNGTNAGIGCLFSSFGNVVSTPTRYGTFNGNIGAIKYYNRALTAQEIQQNFNANRSRFGI